MTTRKRRADDEDGAPAAKKPVCHALQYFSMNI